MLFLTRDKYETTEVDVVLKKLYKQSKSEQITDIKGFSDFLDGQKDINVWLNLGGFMQDDSMFLNGMVASLYRSLFNMQKDSYFYGFIDFGKDDIKLTTYRHRYEVFKDYVLLRERLGGEGASEKTASLILRQCQEN